MNKEKHNIRESGRRPSSSAPNLQVKILHEASQYGVLPLPLFFI